MSGPGRPSLYRPEFCALAREHCRQGGSLDRFARLVGVSARSIDNWVIRFPEFAAAVGEARAEAEAETDRLLYHRAVGWRETVTRTVFCAGQPKDVRLVRDRKPEAAACMRWLCRNLPQQWQRRPGRRPGRRPVRTPKPATPTPAQQWDLLAAAEVVSALHQLSIGYEQIVERILIGRVWPEVHRTIRRHRPHVRAGKFWFCNRLPDQRSDEVGRQPERSRRKEGTDGGPALVPGPTTANPAHKFPSSRPEGPSPEDKPQNVEATSRGCASLRAAWLGTTAVNPAHILASPSPASTKPRDGGLAPMGANFGARPSDNLILRRAPLECLGVNSAAVSKDGCRRDRRNARFAASAAVPTLRDATLRAAPQSL